MPSLWFMALYVYDSDDTNSYNVGLSSGNATAGGFSAATPGDVEDFPRPYRMRKVYGRASGGGRHKLPISTFNNSLFVSGGSFTIPYITGSADFICEGRIGEKRPARI